MADANMGLGNPWDSTFASNPFLGQNNPNLQSVIDASSQDLVNNYNATVQPAFNAAMVRSGSFGNSGIDAANARAQSTLQQNLGNLASGLRFQDYTNQGQMYQWQKGLDQNQNQFDLNFDRSTFNDAFGQQQQQFQNGLGLLGLLNGFNQGDQTTATNVQNTPMDYLSQFANIGSTIGRGGQTQTTQQQSSGNPLLGALGGYQLGSSWANQNNSGTSGWNNGSGSNTGFGTGSMYGNQDYGQFF